MSQMRDTTCSNTGRARSPLTPMPLALPGTPVAARLPSASFATLFNILFIPRIELRRMSRRELSTLRRRRGTCRDRLRPRESTRPPPRMIYEAPCGVRADIFKPLKHTLDLGHAHAPRLKPQPRSVLLLELERGWTADPHSLTADPARRGGRVRANAGTLCTLRAAHLAPVGSSYSSPYSSSP